jgi:itaconate CoA-transferase
VSGRARDGEVMHPASLPLDGLTVVSVEQAVAAPLASRHLADLGATVIKVERRDRGDFARDYDSAVQGLSSAFVWLNRSKQSMTLDLKHERAPGILNRLLDRADVLISNLSPGATERLGLDAKGVEERHPRVIVCTINGYGEGGKFGPRKAYDLLVQAEAGLLSITGTREEPAKAGISVADIAAGMYAFSGILAALIERERTGVARAVPVALFDCLGEWMGHPAYYGVFHGQQPPRMGTSHPMVAPYGSFAGSDGRQVLLAVQNQREWHRFCDVVLERMDLANDPRFHDNSARVANRGELEATIRHSLSAVPTDEIVARLDRADIANARMNDLAEFWAHPAYIERDRWTTVGSPVGEIKALLPPGIPSGLQPRMGPIPALGQNTEEILGWLGYSAAEVREFRAAGVV